MFEQALDTAIVTYSRARSLGFTLEFLALNGLAGLLPSKNPRILLNPELASLVQKELFECLLEDARNIRKGVYPISVLMPESPGQHLKRLPKIIFDGVGIHRRRLTGKTAEFGKKARELLDDLPRYYRRNFHFQTEGYLSERSAELYEHQVEILFGGAADAMRRLSLVSLRQRFGNTDGQGLRFLEIGAGTGRTTRFVKLAFPKAKVVVTDLSEPYLNEARKKLSAFNKIDFIQAAGEDLPFRSGYFDAVYSVFLFHELPREARLKVLSECHRVLKTNGLFSFVDSSQKGDFPRFDTLLENFPKQYHEPFYRDYIESSMEECLKESGFVAIESGRAFFSKFCSATPDPSFRKTQE